MEIYSKDNRTIKELVKLKIRKQREKTGTYLIEGPNLVEEAFKNGVEIVSLLFVQDYQESEELSELYRCYEEKLGREAIITSRDMLGSISDTENPQGVLGVVRMPEIRQDEFFAKAGNNNLVVLDRLQDPGNLGTIIRTADAAGCGGIIVMKGSADVFSPKVVRSCTGSLFRVPILFMQEPVETVKLLKEKGFKVAATGLAGGKLYFHEDISQNTAIIIGNEGNGTCRDFMEWADLVLTIPMKGKTESLNAAVACSLLIYESVRSSYR